MTTSNATDSNAALLAEIARLREDNAKLIAKTDRKVSFKVSEKGALSVYGINARFPTTLYLNQWVKLIAHMPELQAFIDAHKNEFAVKE